MSAQAIGCLFKGKQTLLASASGVVLAVIVGSTCPISAAEYLVGNDADLDAAIAKIDTDGDTAAVIKLTNDLSVSGAVPVSSHPISIDTQGHVLSGAVFSGATQPVTIDGILAPALSVGLQVTNSSIINNASVSNGAGNGNAVTLSTNSTLVNNGEIFANASNSVSSGAAVQVRSGSVLINNGTIQGGNSTIGGGPAIDLGAMGTAGTLTNNGTIRGGDTPGGTGQAIYARAGSRQIINTSTGTLEGGSGAVAIAAIGTGTSLNIINSGVIKAGTGQDNAIAIPGFSFGHLTLELRSGSAIHGNIKGNTTLGDTLRLGGTDNAEFDVSKIGSQYQNFDRFEKTGTSTWALTGTGTVATNWDVQHGNLSIGNGGTSGSIIGDISLSGGSLVFNRSDTVSFDNAITGSGDVAQIGTGKTILNGDYTYDGRTGVLGGTLVINGSIQTEFIVGSGGTLGGIGTIFGDALNSGAIAPGNSIGTLTIDGNYTGDAGSMLQIETQLGGDSSPSDRLVVTGDTLGNSNLKVINTGGAGAATVEGIKIVDVGGTSNGTFSLLGDYVINGEQAVVAGAYGYTLHKNGVSTPTDGDWYLRSELTNPPTTPPTTPPTEPPATPPTEPPSGPIYQPGAPLYEVYSQVLQSLNGVSSLQQRVGNRYWSGAGNSSLAQGDGPGTLEAAPVPSQGGDVAIDQGGIWARIEGAHGKFEPRTSTTDADYDIDTWKLETGIDGQFYESNAGKLIGSLTAHYGHASADINSFFGDGSIDTDGYGVGGTLTWYGQSGFYLDGQAQATWYDSDLRSDTLGSSLADGNDGFGYAFSLESGQRINLNQNWTLTPQAQLAYSNVDIDSFTDPFGADVSFGSGDSLKGRIGLSADYQNAWEDSAGKLARTNLYGIANLYYEFLDGMDTDVAGVNFATENDRTWGGIGAGGSYNWNDDKYSIYSEVSVNTSLSNFGDSYSLNGMAGFKVKF